MIPVFLASALGCSGDPVATTPPAASLPTRAGKYTLTWSTTPSPPPFNTLFSVQTVLSDPTGAPIPGATVTVDASMPQHGHGMPTRPISDPGDCTGTPPVCVHPGGIYQSEGFKLHMPGEWVFRFDVLGPAGPDTLDVRYVL